MKPAPARPSGRRNRPRNDAAIISAHGELTGGMAIVPAGKSLIFPARAGSVVQGVVGHLLGSTEDVQRAIAGRLTPFGHRLHLRRYDAGQSFPNMRLYDTRPGEPGDSGVWRLPLREQDYAKEQFMGDGVLRLRRQSTGTAIAGPVRNGETLAEVLRRLPRGKYVVEACRGFARGRTKTSRADILREEELRAVQRPGSVPRYTEHLGPVTRVESRSSPGSLSVTQASDSRSGDSSRGWGDSLFAAVFTDPAGVFAPKVPLSTAPKHRPRPRREPRPADRRWDRRRSGYKRKTLEAPDASSRTSRTWRGYLGSMATGVTSPREAVRRFRKQLTEPLRDPLRSQRRGHGSSSEGSS